MGPERLETRVEVGGLEWKWGAGEAELHWALTELQLATGHALPTLILTESGAPAGLHMFPLFGISLLCFFPRH